jgi:hypothetical protein
MNPETDMPIKTALFMTLALILSACGSTSQPPTVDPVKISASANILLAGLEQSTAAYLVSNPVTPDVREKIDNADKAAHALIDNMVTAPPASLAQANDDLIKNINAVVAVLPPGTIPPQTQAGITALEIMASVIVQTAAVAGSTPDVTPPAATPATATPPTSTLPTH